MTTLVAESRSRQMPAAKCSDATVMVVDDDEYFRALARTILEPGGFQVIEADSVTSCLMELRSRAVDAVVLDMVMPERDGIEALRELKMLSPETKVLTISGAADSEMFLSVSAHLGADASLNKSEVGSLTSMLRMVLDL